MSHYKGDSADGDRARALMKAREQRADAAAQERKRREDELAKKMDVVGRVRFKILHCLPFSVWLCYGVGADFYGYNV
jgi:hypothetical protein